MSEYQVKENAFEAIIKIGKSDDLLSIIQDDQVVDYVRELSAELLAEQGHKKQALNYLTMLGRNQTISYHLRLRVARILWNMAEHNAAISIMQFFLEEERLEDKVLEQAIDLSMMMNLYSEVISLIMGLVLKRHEGVRTHWHAIGELERIKEFVEYLEQLQKGYELMTIARYKRDYNELRRQNIENNKYDFWFFRKSIRRN